MSICAVSYGMGDCSSSGFCIMMIIDEEATSANYMIMENWKSYTMMLKIAGTGR